jgi:enhancing lycopene biosynthesis protein 2
MARVAVCLSGCGVWDGSEIHEATLTLLSLYQAGAEVICCAPDVEQPTVINHQTGSPSTEKRNVLTESARIARGDIKKLADVRAADIDALVFPGGLGAARNLCTFANDGPQCRVLPDVERLIGEMLDAKKPVGAICIAPALLARVVGQREVNARVTIGNDPDTAAAIQHMGAQHEECPVDSCVVDEKNRLVTTPAYMLGENPADVLPGIKKLVDALLKLIRQ